MRPLHCACRRMQRAIAASSGLCGHFTEYTCPNGLAKSQTGTLLWPCQVHGRSLQVSSGGCQQSGTPQYGVQHGVQWYALLVCRPCQRLSRWKARRLPHSSTRQYKLPGNSTAIQEIFCKWFPTELCGDGCRRAAPRCESSIGRRFPWRRK